MKMFRSFCFLVFAVGVSCPGSHGETYLPAKGIVFPSDHGVYVLDRGVFAVVHDGLVPTRLTEARPCFTFSRKLTILISDDWVADSKADLGAIVIDDARHVGEDPMPHVPVAAERVPGHRDMVMIVPDEPLEPGLYSIKTGHGVHSYQFGVETQDVVAFWKSVLQEHPKSWQAENLLGTALYLRGKMQEALPHFSHAVELNPRNAESHNNLGLALSSQGQVDGAIKQYEISTQIMDNPAVETNLGNAYSQAKRYDDAIRTYRHALELNPRNPSALCNLGLALLQEGKADDAIPEFQKALDADPDMPQAQVDLQEALDMKAKKQAGN